MHDTSFIVRPEKFDRLVAEYRTGNTTERSRKIRALSLSLPKPTTAAADFIPPRPTISASRKCSCGTARSRMAP